MRDKKGRFIKGHQQWLGKKRSQETIEKIKHTFFKEGHKPWNAGKIGCFDDSTISKMSLSKKGKKNLWLVGWKHTDETKKKMGLVRKGKYLGEKGCNWRGGVTPKNRIARNSLEFKEWRESVFIRDNFTCKKCNSRKKYLHPHHLQNFSNNIGLRFLLENGVTLCIDCHKKFHHIYGTRNNDIRQFEEFINNNL